MDLIQTRYQLNRFNSPCSVTILNYTNRTTNIEYFTDLQMAYLSMVNFIKNNESDWDEIPAFGEFGDLMEEIGFMYILSTNLLISIHYD